jgi:hypothetical protein
MHAAIVIPTSAGSPDARIYHEVLVIPRKRTRGLTSKICGFPYQRQIYGVEIVAVEWC